MESFQTDRGTLQLIAALDRSAAIQLAAFLETCDALRYGNPSASILFSSSDFVGRSDVVEMKLERNIADKGRRILATVKLVGGALWRRGQLRVPGAVLPEAVRTSLKGRMIEDLVAEPPFRGFEVTGAVQDGKGETGHLRLRCTAEKVADIDIDPEAAPMHDLADLERRAAALADGTIDPAAAHVLASLDRREALLALLRTAERKPGTDVDLPATYSGILSPDAPSRFEGTGTQSGPHLHGDVLALKRSKDRYQLVGYAVTCGSAPPTRLQALIEGGLAHVAEDADPDRTSSSLDALGFDVQGMRFGREKVVYGGMRSWEMTPVRTLRDALGVGA